MNSSENESKEWSKAVVIAVAIGVAAMLGVGIYMYIPSDAPHVEPPKKIPDQAITPPVHVETAEEHFRTAYDYFTRRRVEEAEKEFRVVIHKYPGNPLAADAKSKLAYLENNETREKYWGSRRVHSAESIGEDAARNTARFVDDMGTEPVQIVGTVHTVGTTSVYLNPDISTETEVVVEQLPQNQLRMLNPGDGVNIIGVYEDIRPETRLGSFNEIVFIGADIRK